MSTSLNYTNNIFGLNNNNKLTFCYSPNLFYDLKLVLCNLTFLFHETFILFVEQRNF